jgi:predicted CoA-binding protein
LSTGIEAEILNSYQAREAGLLVVMDKCILKEHEKLRNAGQK